jgi:hypothetical protein
MTYLPKHIVLPKIESLVLLFRMTGFEENVSNFLFLAIQCVLAKTQSSNVFEQTSKNNNIL